MSGSPTVPLLEGPRVRLRPLAPDDLRPTFDWYNNPETVAPYDRFTLDTFEAFEHSVETASQDPESLAPRLLIERKEDSARIGVVGYYRSHPVFETTDIWYVIADPAARGRGYGREAVTLLVDHLFATQALARVGATCDVENLPSAKLLEGVGFRREGTLHAALFHHARWHDVAAFGVTRSDWAARGQRV